MPEAVQLDIKGTYISSLHFLLIIKVICPKCVTSIFFYSYWFSKNVNITVVILKIIYMILDLESDGFGDRHLFESFVAATKNRENEENDGEVVGYSTYYFTYSTWQGKTLFMEDMYIKPEHRKHGIALSFYHLISQVQNYFQSQVFQNSEF